MDGKKGKKIFPQHGVATKIGVIDQTRRERSRKEAVERLLGSFGALPNLPTNEEIEGSYEKNHVLNPPRR